MDSNFRHHKVSCGNISEQRSSMLLESKSVQERPTYGSMIVKTSREMEKEWDGYKEV